MAGGAFHIQIVLVTRVVKELKGRNGKGTLRLWELRIGRTRGDKVRRDQKTKMNLSVVNNH